MPMRMDGPSGMWLVRVVRCNANCASAEQAGQDERGNGAGEQRLPGDPAQRSATAAEVGVFPELGHKSVSLKSRAPAVDWLSVTSQGQGR